MGGTSMFAAAGYKRASKKHKRSYKRAYYKSKYKRYKTRGADTMRRLPGPHKTCDSGGEIYALDQRIGTLTAQCRALLNGIVRGPAVYQRIGNKVIMRNIRISGTLETTEANSNSMPAKMFKVSLVYDRAPTGGSTSINTAGGFPNWNCIYSATANDGSNQTKLWSPRNVEYLERFKVLREWYWRLPGVLANGGNPGSAVTLFDQQPVFNAAGNVKDGQPTFYIDEFIDLQGLCTRYTASTAGTGIIDEIHEGSLFLVGTTSDSVGDGIGSAAFTLNFQARLNYEDLP